MLRVGLTGGIASGKSTVARMFQEQGFAIIEADALAHDYLSPENPVSREVIGEFGSGILSPSQSIDRSKLGEIVFADPEKLARLNNIIHPHVLADIESKLAELARPGGPAVAVVVAALHIEAGYHEHFDRLVVAWCRPEQQLGRLQRRGFSLEQAQRRIAAQMPIEEKRKLADDVVDCSGSFEETRRQVSELAKKFKELAA